MRARGGQGTTDVSEGQNLLELAPGTVLRDRYRIVRRIGAGGMGVVYEAENTIIRKRVALKCLRSDKVVDDTSVERFLREARAAAAIDHEHVIRVSDFWHLENGVIFMVMEYLDGETVADLIQREANQGMQSRLNARLGP